MAVLTEAYIKSTFKHKYKGLLNSLLVCVVTGENKICCYLSGTGCIFDFRRKALQLASCPYTCIHIHVPTHTHTHTHTHTYIYIYIYADYFSFYWADERQPDALVSFFRLSKGS